MSKISGSLKYYYLLIQNSVKNLGKHISRYTQKTFAASYGIFVLSTAHLLRAGLNPIAILIIALGFYVLNLFDALTTRDPRGFLRSTINVLLAFFWVLLVPAVMLRAVIIALCILLKDIILDGVLIGAAQGWSEGFLSINHKVINIFASFEPFFTHIYHLVRINLFFSDHFNFFNFEEMFNQYSFGANDFTSNNFQNAFRATHVHHNIPCAMNTAEINALIIKPRNLALFELSPELSHDEIIRLKQMHVSKIDALLIAYQERKHALDHDVCPVMFDRPERKNVIVVFKQYESDAGLWLAVPSSSRIFDKDSFIAGCKRSVLHPETRDSLVSPGTYSKDHKVHKTRYRFHAYYPNSASTGVSQELDILRAKLHQYLASYVPEETSQASRSRTNSFFQSEFFSQSRAKQSQQCVAMMEHEGPKAG